MSNEPDDPSPGSDVTFKGLCLPDQEKFDSSSSLPKLRSLEPDPAPISSSVVLPQSDSVINIVNEDEPTKNKTQRKQNYCLLCDKLVGKFARHIQTKHKATEFGRELLSITGTSKEKRDRKMKITGVVIKKWNAEYNQKLADKRIEMKIDSSTFANKLITVKKRTVSTVPSVKCLHCEGFYRRDRLRIHLKRCSVYIESGVENDSKKSIVKTHGSPNLPTMNHISSAFRKHILQTANVDEIMDLAIHDPLIMKFGSEFHESRRASSDRDYVIREIRDVSKLLHHMKAISPNIRSFIDVLNPAHFDVLLEGALKMAGYDPETGNVKVPSVAYRLSQPLRDICAIVKADAIVELYTNISPNERSTLTMMDDFLDLISKKWKSKIGRICTKTKKLLRVDRIDKLAIEDDIIKVAAFIEGKYRYFLRSLAKDDENKKVFDLLIHMLVVHIMLLIRRRPVDFKHALLRHYSNIDRHDELLDLIRGYDLTDENIKDCKRFHIFYVPGKNLEIVPIVLTPLMKQVLDTLLNYRKLVNITNDMLFSLSCDKNIQPAESLKIVKRYVNGLKKPEHLTGNGLRHQAATFSRLQSSHPQYQDYLASTLGHTLAVHKKHYDLPMGILQKIMVCPILHNIMTGNKNKSTEPKADTLPVLKTEVASI